MKTATRFSAIAALLAYGLAVPATAQAPSAPAKDKDPNEIVCEKQVVLGSRLATKRRCLTRAQWAEERRESKNLIEGLQRGGSGCPNIKTC